MDVLLLRLILSYVGWKHVDAFVEIDVIQVRKVHGNCVRLDSRHQQKSALSAIGGHFHVGDRLWWQAQAIELFVCLNVPQPYVVVRCSKQEVRVLIIKAHMTDVRGIFARDTDIRK